MEVKIIKKVKLSMDEQKKYQGERDGIIGLPKETEDFIIVMSK